MVRLIGAAVNVGDRPQGCRPAETTILVKATAPEARRAAPAAALDKTICGCKTAPQTKMEETMDIDRRQLALPALALGLLTVVPAFAGADEDAVAKNVEAFRVAQAAGNAEGLASLCADDLSYSHSNAKVDTKASLLDGTAKANYKWTSLEYKDPTVRVVGPAAIVRFTFVGEQEFTDGKKTPQNLHILMNWQKQGGDWKLLSRAATKL
jgi:ketosteroid isomerase-like protein